MVEQLRGVGHEAQRGAAGGEVADREAALVQAGAEEVDMKGFQVV